MNSSHFLRIAIFVSMLPVFLASPSWSADSASTDFLSRGISFYEKKDYEMAQDCLSKAVSGEHKNAAVAHYYFANCLMQLKKTNAALDEYEHCYKLAPFSSFSGYCRMMLLRYGRTPDGKVETKAAGVHGSELAPPAPVVQEKPHPEPVKAAHDLASNEELKQLKGRLPHLVVITKETPLASDVMADTVYFRSAFVAEAEQRKTRAFDRLEQSRQTLKRAESVSHSFVPSVKSFGEADEEFRVRRAKAEETVASLLEPFKENVNEAEKVFQAESSLLDNCINARNGYQ